MTGPARHLTLTQRLLAIVAMSVVPAAAGLVYFILAIHADREREVRDQALRTSGFAALEIERIITGADGILRTVALVPTIRHLTADCDAFLTKVAARLPQLRGFVVADPEGKVRCASGFSFGPDGVGGQSWLARRWMPPPSSSANTPDPRPRARPTCRSRSRPAKRPTARW